MRTDAAYVQSLERRIRNQRARLRWYEAKGQSWCRSHWSRCQLEWRREQRPYFAERKRKVTDERKTGPVASLKAARRQAINGYNGAHRGGFRDDADEYEYEIIAIELRMRAEGIPFEPWVPGQPAPEDES